MCSSSPYVQAHNLLNGLPYKDNQFDVVYHSQVLEHFPKERAADFLRECFRVLKPGGILRVVVPDLENIAGEYLRRLRENIENPGEQSIANYEWILLEMYDQTVRNYPGGQMAKFLQHPSLLNEKYVVDRIGYVGRSIIESSRKNATRNQVTSIKRKLRRFTPQKLFSYVWRLVKKVFSTEAARIGAFRLGGEIHMWMYDRFSLSRVLSQVGFQNIEHLSAYESSIPDWERYELDIKEGAVVDPTSLFMEAVKPICLDVKET
jgi:predicted SAM-dependent methyltransferase